MYLCIINYCAILYKSNPMNLTSNTASITCGINIQRLPKNTEGFLSLNAEIMYQMTITIAENKSPIRVDELFASAMIIIRSCLYHSLVLVRVYEKEASDADHSALVLVGCVDQAKYR